MLADLEWHDFGRQKTPKNSIVAPTLKWTANLILMANGHRLSFRTAKINRRTATNFRGERPRTLKANGHPYNIIFEEIK